MKQLLLYILTVLLIVLTLACQGEEKMVSQEMVDLQVSVQLPKASSTRGGEDETAVGIVPHLTGNLLFLMTDENHVVDDIIIADAFQVLHPASGIQISFNRVLIKYIYVIGNVEVHKMGIELTEHSTAASIKSALLGQNIQKLQYMMANQGSSTDHLDPKRVSVSGRISTLNIGQGMSSIIIQLRPSISRIEIGSFRAIQKDYSEDQDGSDISDPITSFTLDKIFINNAFEYMGTDYLTYPSGWNSGSWSTASPAQMIAYNWSADEFYDVNDVQNNPGAKGYSSRYVAAVNPGTATDAGGNPSLKPSQSKHFWSFYVCPAWKENPTYDPGISQWDIENPKYLGTKITPFMGDKDKTPSVVENNRVYYSAMPVIVCRFSDVTPQPEWYNDETGFGWLTIRKYRDALSGDIISTMTPGKVYQIEKIEFTSRDIHSQPLTEREGWLYAILSVRDWTEVDMGGNPMPLR